MQHILIENLSAYEYFAARGEKGQKRIWYTSSPWLLEFLPTRQEEVISLEAWVGQRSIDDLGLRVKDLTRNIATYLDEKFEPVTFPSRVGEVMMPGIRRMLFSILYKHCLLRHWVDEVDQSGGTGTILGSPVLENRDLLPSRLDTLYTVLAGCMALPACIRIVESPRPTAADLLARMRKTGTSRFERFMLLLNLDLRGSFFKVWRTLLKERNIQVVSGMNRPDVMVVDDCELSEEMLLSLVLRGCRLRRLRLKKGEENPEAGQGKAEHMEDLRKRLRDWLHGSLGGAFSPVEGDVDGLSGLILQMLAAGVRGCLISASDKERLLKEVRGHGENGWGDPKAILSNAFSSPLQRTFFYLLREKHIPVFACEHGVTGGLCLMNEHWIEENHLRLSDYCFCYSEVSKEYHGRVLNAPSRAFVVGMPERNRKVRLRPLQKALARRALGLQRSGRVVVYICNLYFNNYIYSPGGCSDYFYHQVKKQMVYDVLSGTKDQCLLKLYPTFRYAEEDPFLRLLPLPQNVKPLQFIEYRYLRAIGDIVICDSPQSTLGWVWSARVPLIYLDLPSNPLLKPVAEAFDRAVFRIDCSREDWPARARDLLLLPHRELLRRWEDKRRARAFAEEKYICGPPGKAAKRAARVLVDETLNWHDGRRKEQDSHPGEAGTRSGGSA